MKKTLKYLFGEGYLLLILTMLVITKPISEPLVSFIAVGFCVITMPIFLFVNSKRTLSDPKIKAEKPKMNAADKILIQCQHKRCIKLRNLLERSLKILAASNTRKRGDQLALINDIKEALQPKESKEKENS